MFERITGPFHGYFIAAYACPMGELGTEYLGQFKICSARPDSFWGAESLRHGSCEGTSRAAALALDGAELRAMLEIGNMPPATTKVLAWRTKLQGW